jgi:hypothetical protein
VGADGGVFAFGDAGFHGSLGGTVQSSPIVSLAADAATGGYWLVAGDGTATAFGAPALGPQPDAPTVAPVVAAASTADGNGFWEVTSGGAVYAYGDASFEGPVAPLSLNAPIDGIASDPTTGGYWLVAADGGVYAFGAGFFGAG